jgi:hypothetical protein
MKPSPESHRPQCPPAFRRAASAAPSHRLGQYLRRDTMGGEPTYTMHRFCPVVRELSLPSPQSPAPVRPIVGKGLERFRAQRPELPSLIDRAKCGHTAQGFAVRIRSEATRPTRASTFDVRPVAAPRLTAAQARLDLLALAPPGDRFASPTDATPAHFPPYRSPAARSSKTTKQLGAACSEPL